MSVGASRNQLRLVAQIPGFQSGTKTVLAGSAYLTGVWQLTMETQVVSMEDKEAYSVQFLTMQELPFLFTSKIRGHIHLSTADAVNEATARMLHLLEGACRQIVVERLEG